MKKRVISAIIALAIIIPFIILGGYYFAFAVSIISLLGYKEIITVRKEKKMPLSMIYLGGLFLILIVLSNINAVDMNLQINLSVIGAMLIGFILPVIIYDNKDYNFNDAIYLLGSVLFLGVAFGLFIVMRNYSVKYLVLLILITTMTDMFAQFFGSLIGRNKFAPNISPNKTWEGTLMGSLMGSFIATTYYVTIINSETSVIIVAILMLLLTFVGQLGDLLFSAIKRFNGVKDFSNIMPGHGGILDRLDSLLFVLIAFMLLAQYL